MPFSQPTIHSSGDQGSVVVIGAGRMGKLHLGALARAGHWRLSGVFDHHPGHSSSPSGELDVWLAHARPQAAIVAVPPEAHETVARACLEAGCHVLLEKPLCPSSTSARALAKEFALRERVLFGGHTERFNPFFKALTLHREGIGRLVGIETWRWGALPDRMDKGGVVMDLAIHDLDLIQRLVADQVVTRSAIGSKNDGHIVEVCASIQSEGIDIEVQAKWCDHKRRGIRLIGDVGVLEADLLARSLSLKTEMGETRLQVAWSDPLEAEHAAFACACRGVFDAPMDLEPQIRAIELAEAILETLA